MATGSISILKFAQMLEAAVKIDCGLDLTSDNFYVDIGEVASQKFLLVPNISPIYLKS